MKIHSGSMNQLASTASSQSSEGKVVERMEESTHRKLRGEDAKNTSEESTNKLSLTEHSCLLLTTGLKTLLKRM